MTINDGEKMLTTKEVADMLGMTVWTVRQLSVRERKITYIRVGDHGQLRFKKSDVEKFIESRTVQSGDS